MLVDNTNGKLDEIKETHQAKMIRGQNSLEENLTYLATYADHDNNGRTRCLLYPDFAPLSLAFVMEVRDKETGEYKRWFNGGLIYHGPVDGYGSGSGPTFSCTVNPTHGWSVHT
jgi:hypothetical protein